jgi:hypothetical protein
VPNFLFEDAARLLNHVADYMVNHAKKPVRVGETMAVSDLCVFRFLPATPRQDDLEHYKDERGSRATSDENESHCAANSAWA